MYEQAVQAPDQQLACFVPFNIICRPYSDMSDVGTAQACALVAYMTYPNKPTLRYLPTYLHRYLGELSEKGNENQGKAW